MNYQIKLPSCVYGGQGSIEKINEVLLKEKAERAIIFTDEGIRRAGLLSSLTKRLEEMNIAYDIFDECKPEPTYSQIEEILEQAEKTYGDCVIGLGGGSVMDTAKLAGVLLGAPYTLEDLMKDASIARKMRKTIMIPTTCGTGAEATCNAIVAIPEESSKQGIVNNGMISDYVILDPDMIKKLPKAIIAATGVDALAHAVECYTSKKATPFSDIYALEAARLIFGNLKEAYRNPDNMEAKMNMLLGAFYGGIAITGSGTTAVHALSYPLGGKYHIAHGVSNAILFAPVMSFNKDACEKELADISDVIHPAGVKMSISEKAQYVIDEIEDIVKVTNIPISLSKYGVTENELDFLTIAGSQQQRLLVNNKKEMNMEDIRKIYRKILR